MEEKEFCVGIRIRHDKYGEGIISENNDLTYKVIFVRVRENMNSLLRQRILRDGIFV